MQSGTNERDPAKADAARTCVRLTQGSSAYASWVLQETQEGAALTIGSGPDCDWTIKAARVPAHALSLLLSEGKLYVCSGAEEGVLLNGRALGRGWQVVSQGTRLDIGLARLEITSADALAPGPVEEHGPAYHEDLSATAQTWVVHSAEPPPRPSDSGPTVMVQRELVEEILARDEAEAAALEAAQLDDAEISGIRPSLASLQRGRHWDGRSSRDSLLDAPSVLGGKMLSRHKPWLYALAGAVVGSMYVVWVLLLDR